MATLNENGGRKLPPFAFAYSALKSKAAPLSQLVTPTVFQVFATELPTQTTLAGLRTDLADIGRAINEAMPRRALEALQSEVHALADRIGEGYGRGGDPAVLETIERGLARVHSTLNEMTPAEGLAGFNARNPPLAGTF